MGAAVFFLDKAAVPDDAEPAGGGQLHFQQRGAIPLKSLAHLRALFFVENLERESRGIIPEVAGYIGPALPQRLEDNRLIGGCFAAEGFVEQNVRPDRAESE